MSEEIEQAPVTEAPDTSAPLESPVPDELTMLKQRARLMNINFSNNIGIEALREKIKDTLEGTTKAEEPVQSQVNPLEPEEEKPMNIRERLQKEQLRLVRVRVTNLDPKKKDLKGEIFTIANEYLGTVRKFVPYGEATDGGYHIPWCIYNELKERQFQDIRTSERGNGGQIRVEQRMVREFAFELLNPLTEQELKELATAQLAAGSIENQS